jgi:hypothetical protein
VDRNARYLEGWQQFGDGAAVARHFLRQRAAAQVEGLQHVFQRRERIELGERCEAGVVADVECAQGAAPLEKRERGQLVAGQLCRAAKNEKKTSRRGRETSVLCVSTGTPK